MSVRSWRSEEGVRSLRAAHDPSSSDGISSVNLENPSHTTEVCFLGDPRAIPWSITAFHPCSVGAVEPGVVGSGKPVLTDEVIRICEIDGAPVSVSYGNFVVPRA